MYQLYGHQNSGAAAIEAALELCEIPYRFIDVESSPEAAQALEKLNPLKQIPTLQLPDGSILTESAAILIHLGLTFPQSNLLPENAADAGSGHSRPGVHRQQLLCGHRHHRLPRALVGRGG